MSTWAARLSTGSKSPESRNASNQGTPFFGPQASPISSMAGECTNFSLTTSPTAGNCGNAPASWKTTKQLIEDEEVKAVKEVVRQCAERHNSEPAEVPVLRLPNDLWAYITCFFGYADVMQLAHTCRRLWRYLMRAENIWEQQLRFFHEDILDMRGGALLMTDFAIPPRRPTTTVASATSTGSWDGKRSQATGRQRHAASTFSACHRFWFEKQLYVLDAQREWHFKELSSLEDTDTGVFTVPLHLGQERLASSAAAPFSRPTEAQESGFDSVSNVSFNLRAQTLSASEGRRRGGSGVGEGAPSASDLDGSPTTSVAVYSTSASPAPAFAASPTAESTVRVPAVGSPFVGPHRGNLNLKVYRPIRPGERILKPEACHHHHSHVPFCELDDEVYLESDTAAAQATEMYFPTDQPATAADEEAALAYVIALSEAEANGLPPPPPPMYRRTVNNNGRHNRGALSGGADGSMGTGSFFSSSLGGSKSPYPPYPTTTQSQPPFLKPSELMTVAEMISSGTIAQSRIPIRDVTHVQSVPFLQALDETLKGAKRRRLHLGNHHRAVRNNGQTTHHRSGRPRSGGVQRQQQHQQQRELMNLSAPEVASRPRSASGPTAFPLSPSAALAGASPPAPDLSSRASSAAAEQLNTPPMTTATDMARRQDGPTTRLLFTDPNAIPPPQQQQQQQPPPPVNRMLAHFTGTLLEITKREAYAVTSQLMGHPELVDDYSIFHHIGNGGGGGGSAGASERDAAGCEDDGDALPALKNRSYPRTRFFLLPELAAHGYIGLIIVDVVRVLVAVEKDDAHREENNSDWALDEGRLQAGRLFRPGHGYNAQYYQRDEMRTL